MLTLKSRPSLARHYFWFIAIVGLMIISGSFWAIQSSYRSLNDFVDRSVKTNTKRVDDTLDESLGYVANFMHYMGEKIIRLPKVTPAGIASVLQNRVVRSERFNDNDVFTWTFYDFVNPKGYVIASSTQGVLHHQAKVLPEQRLWMYTAPKAPWVLHPSYPDIGIISGEHILPVGMGVTNDKGNFFGIITIGLNIDKLTRRLEKNNDSELTDFVILFQDKYLVTASSGMNQKALDSLDIKSLHLNGKEGEFTSFDTPVRLGNAVFTHFEKMQDYPFTILAGYNHDVVRDKLWDSIIPKITNLGILVVFFAVVLYFFRKLVIVPAQQLGDAAEHLSQGNFQIAIPKQYSDEMYKLGEQLSNVKTFMKNEKEGKEVLEATEKQLKEALTTIRDSDREREAFLRDMHRSLYLPIRAILNGIVVAKKLVQNPSKVADYDLVLDAIYDAGKQLESLTTEFLNPIQLDMNETIEKCLILQKRYTAEKGIKLKSNIEDDIPLIWADRLRLRQVILSTMYHALMYVPENDNKTLEVTASLTKSDDGTPEWLDIIIEDDGFRANEEYRLASWERQIAFDVTLNRDPNMMNLGINEIRHLVGLHHGTFKVEVRGKEGTRFLIRLPYLPKEQLEVHPSTRTHYEEQARKNNEKIEATRSHSENVIEFPDKKGKKDDKQG